MGSLCHENERSRFLATGLKSEIHGVPIPKDAALQAKIRLQGLPPLDLRGGEREEPGTRKNIDFGASGISGMNSTRREDHFYNGEIEISDFVDF